MLNRIIKFSLTNRVTILLLTAVVMIWGCITLVKSDIDIFPDLNAPTVVVMTEAPGMAPEEVERMVTYPIETTLNGATDVRRVRSSSATGFSVVWVEFDWDADPYIARQIVSEKLTAVAEQLPPGAGVPTLGPQSSILGEMMIIGLTSNPDSTSMTDLRTIADRVISPRLLSLGGVSQVSVLGGDVAQYQIKLNTDRMRHYGITLDQVSSAVENLNVNTSGGVLYDFGNEYLIKADIHTSSIDEMSKSVVSSNGTSIVTLADIADIEIGPETPKLGVASERAKSAVLVTVTKQPSTSTIDLTNEIDRMLEELRPTLPADVHLSTDIFRQSDFIANSISNLQQSLLEGALFVIVVLFFFLMNFRTTLISVVALPLSIIVTVLTLHWMGLTINTMSLGGMAIAIGSLVDDAIVDVENVYKRLRQNRSLPPEQRTPLLTIVFEASKEVRLPILNSTLIIAASFLPLFFLDGIGGRMLIPLGISFLTALLASTIVALTVTPVLCSYLLAGDKALRQTDREPWLARKLGAAYSRLLPKALSHKKTILSATAALLLIAIGCFFTLGRGFLPSFNEGSLTINVSTLPGISLDESDHLGREAEKIILSMPEITTVARKTGRAELDEHSLGVNVSEIEAPYRLSSRSRSDMIKELREKLSHLPGTNIEIGQPISHRIDAMLSGTEAQIAIKIFGPDLDRLHSLATQVKGSISQVDGIVDVNVEQQIGRPQLDIRPRRDMMARYGITNQQLSTFVATMIAGQPVSQVYRDGIPFDVILKVDPADRDRLADISTLLIDSNEGKIPLSYVADIISTTGPNTINRENVSRRIVISANVEGRDLRSVVNQIQTRINQDVTLPEGYYVQFGGQFESEAQASRTLALASIGALLLIFLLLMQEYKSTAQSLVILANMPLALIGGVMILFFTRSEVNIPAIIGFISLMGVATRGGMLLLSRYNSLASHGLPLPQRIARGSADRLNPIIMTALTSALALIPLALRGSEPGNEIQAPMALVLLGGLLSSTILNLFIVPILYSIISRNRNLQSPYPVE
ncbi:MAG: efflux RND transporter permease subunit [Bacteroides sp.]|nr:efflux RND transporter permease subunit [Bacteroides sp.]